MVAALVAARAVAAAVAARLVLSATVDHLAAAHELAHDRGWDSDPVRQADHHLPAGSNHEHVRRDLAPIRRDVPAPDPFADSHLVHMSDFPFHL